MSKYKEEFYGRLLSFLSKKFIIACFILIVSTFMVLQGKISGEYWLGIMTADVLAYDFSNAVAKKYKRR
ncbi:MAG: hypothetical protein ACOC3B_02970 [Bacillota bacterium]